MELLVMLMRVTGIGRLVCLVSNLSRIWLLEEPLSHLAILLKTGDKLILGGGTELEITQIGKRCHRRCEIFEQLGDCIMPHEGAFAKVIKGGMINVGDDIVVIDD
jgi:hypothetical protein